MCAACLCILMSTGCMYVLCTGARPRHRQMTRLPSGTSDAAQMPLRCGSDADQVRLRCARSDARAQMRLRCGSGAPPPLHPSACRYALLPRASAAAPAHRSTDSSCASIEASTYRLRHHRHEQRAGNEQPRNRDRRGRATALLSMPATSSCPLSLPRAKVVEAANCGVCGVPKVVNCGVHHSQVACAAAAERAHCSPPVPGRWLTAPAAACLTAGNVRTHDCGVVWCY